MDKYLLSVCIPVFNGEKYIAQTIQSILNQITSFKYQIIIADDNSTDNTVEICKKFMTTNPNICLLQNSTNLGMSKNQNYVIQKARTELIAYIDSDDYYINMNFLQSQVDFLKKNVDLSVVFSNVEIFSEVDSVTKLRFDKNSYPPEVFDLSEFFTKSIPITNSSIVFRSKYNNTIPLWFENYFQYDWLLHIHHGLNGLFGFNNLVGIRYRIHDNNATNSRNSEKKFLDGIELIYRLRNYLPVQHQKHFKHPLFEMNSLAFYYLSRKKVFQYIKWYVKWIFLAPIGSWKFRDQFYLFRQALGLAK
jgi:glycosyltransferase involved in cell wall biosynthesis